jgi:hypothetical protein
MAIHIVCGKPGGGKSLFAMHLLVKELRESDRNIVTNLAVRVPELNAYMQRFWPDEDFRVLQRLRILSEQESKDFWNHRRVIDNEMADEQAGKAPVTDKAALDKDDAGKGVAYFLDEAHEHFNAREWANLHRSALHYWPRESRVLWVVR